MSKRCAALIAWLCQTACGSSDAIITPPPPRTIVVPTVVDALPEGFIGVVVPKGVAEITAPFATRVVAFQANLGDKVLAGQALATLDLEPLQAELISAMAEVSGAQAGVRAAGASVSSASKVLQSQKKLERAGLISGAQVEQARLAVSTASADLNRMKATLTSATAKVEHLQRRERDATLTSPIAGVLTARYVEAGARVDENQAVLRVIAGPLEIKFAIPSSAERPSVGATVEIRTKDSAQTFLARVRSVSPELDSIAKMHTAEAELIDGSGTARAGEICTVTPERKAETAPDTRTKKGALTEPSPTKQP